MHAYVQLQPVENDFLAACMRCARAPAPLCGRGCRPVRSLSDDVPRREFLGRFEFPKGTGSRARWALMAAFADHYWTHNQHTLTFRRGTVPIAWMAQSVGGPDALACISLPPSLSLSLSLSLSVCLWRWRPVVPSDTTVLLLYSLLILSTDLASPLVRNKMTKREFIRNVDRIAAPDADRLSPEYLGQLYDYIFLQARVRPLPRLLWCGHCGADGAVCALGATGSRGAGPRRHGGGGSIAAAPVARHHAPGRARPPQ
jgi:hypothetical protein